MPATSRPDRNDAPRQSWTIIIFCYNEYGNLIRVVHSVQEVLQQIAAPGQSEIVLVDDHSTDGTAELIGQLSSEESGAICMRSVLHEQNLGIGRALLSGYREARFENICAVPGDGQFDVDELKRVPPFSDQEFISFYRKRRPSYTLYRQALSHTNRKINRWFLGINLRDVNWVKVYKRTQLHSMQLKLQSSLVESEICSNLFRRGVRPIEFECEYLPRLSGESKGASLKTTTRAVREVAKLILSRRS